MIKEERGVMDFIDKFNLLSSSNKRIFIRTKPSTSFPKGKIYIGAIKFVSNSYVEIIDDRESFCRIYYSEIETPTDVQEAMKRLGE